MFLAKEKFAKLCGNFPLNHNDKRGQRGQAGHHMTREEGINRPRVKSEHTVHSKQCKSDNSSCYATELVYFYINACSLLCWGDKKLTSVTLACEIKKFSAENSMNIKQLQRRRP